MVVEVVYLSMVPFLAAFAALALFGKPLRKYASVIAIILAAVSLAIVSVSFLEFKQPFESNVSWLKFGTMDFQFGFAIDNLSMLFAFLIALVSFLVFVYSHSYMGAEGDMSRFYAEMSLFAGSMLGIVLSSNFVTLLIFWEIVGLSSYLLIGFWYDRKEAAAAAKKAFVIILIGDIAMLAGIALLSTMFPSLNFSYINANATYSTPLLTALTLVLVGAISKSAQFPLHVWLGDAMEGPTPVSTLLHSATMVKAGIFVIARLLPLYGLVNLLPPIAWIGLLSAFIGATIAFSELDIKRILAFSTVSQLGFMTLALGTGSLGAGILYSFTQTFSKASIFMIAGILMHRFKDERDIRKIFIAPGSRIFVIALIGVLGLAGLPPLSDFWGKSGVMGSVLGSNVTLFALAMLTSFVSALYISRWLFLPTGNFIRASSKSEYTEAMKEKTPISMMVPTLVLFAGVVLAGLFASPVLGLFGETESFNVLLIVSESLVVVAALAVSYAVFYKGIIRPETFSNGMLTGLVYKVFANKYWIDTIYEKFAVGLTGYVFKALDWFDRKIVDEVVNVFNPLTHWMSGGFRRMVSGFAQDNVTGIIIGLILMIVLMQALRMMVGGI